MAERRCDPPQWHAASLQTGCLFVGDLPALGGSLARPLLGCCRRPGHGRRRISLPDDGRELNSNVISGVPCSGRITIRGSLDGIVETAEGVPAIDQGIVHVVLITQV